MDGYEFYGNKYWDIDKPEYVDINIPHSNFMPLDDEDDRLRAWIKDVPNVQSMTTMQDYLYL
ncbi:hypothetical protein KGV31_002146 [Vibrio parahaemolyticus]|nr:hypothetical protein [Vibrio parahaemolyticus]EHU0344290.1 hypothetical protein [Vibrio parahaemolyticus]EHU0354324.1 hypothetical protein [Vibrio parahaemolyticus]